MRKIILLLVLMSMIQSSFAGFFSARELNEKIYQYPYSSACYVAGIYEGIDLTIKQTGKLMSVGTLTDLFKKEMYLHPEKGDLSAASVIAYLLIKHNIYKVKP